MSASKAPPGSDDDRAPSKKPPAAPAIVEREVPLSQSDEEARRNEATVAPKETPKSDLEDPLPDPTAPNKADATAILSEGPDVVRLGWVGLGPGFICDLELLNGCLPFANWLKQIRSTVVDLLVVSSARIYLELSTLLEYVYDCSC
jgi:hypothetical protein